MRITANIVDIHNKRIFYGECHIQAGRISEVMEKGEEKGEGPYLMPGFVDAHVHIESSMLVPSEFARLAVCHGTVATVSDPHEIANVLGVKGVEYMLKNAGHVNFKFNFGAPSCVPATEFETAGDEIDEDGIRALMARDDIRYLAEMMNFPGVLNEDPAVMGKIQAAQEAGKPVDGHAPGLTGERAEKYIEAGITTDHECISYEEALFKLKNGMKIAIREGSAAKNFEALHSLIEEYPDMVMLCSDDKHPDDLLEGHINALTKRAIDASCPLFDVLRAACLNPVVHYNLDVGTLQEGDPADCILVKDLKSFEVLATYIDGEKVFDGEKAVFDPEPPEIVNRFDTETKRPGDFAVRASGNAARVIGVQDGSLMTRELHRQMPVIHDCFQADLSKDVLKITVVNRYSGSLPSTALVHGFGLHSGAIASSVAHDSHNIVAVGVDNLSLARAVNAVIEHQGGIAAVQDDTVKVLPLPVAGIMSDKPGEEVAKLYTEIDAFAKKELGSSLSAPFMTLSFTALLVIPKLKLSDKGLFDGEEFAFVPVSLDTLGVLP